MRIHWDLGPNARLDFVAYAAQNLNGKRTVVQVYHGKAQGSIQTEDLASCIVAAPLGTRVVFRTASGKGWEASPWRCVALLKGQSIPPQSAGDLPRVRIPNLDLLNRGDAKKIDPDREQSYPMAESVAAGTGWSFGRIGDLRNKIVEIWVRSPLDPDGLPIPGEATAPAPTPRPSNLGEPTATPTDDLGSHSVQAPRSEAPEASLPAPPARPEAAREPEVAADPTAPQLAAGTVYEILDPIVVLGKAGTDVRELMKEALSRLPPGSRVVDLRFSRRTVRKAPEITLFSGVVSESTEAEVLIVERLA